MPVPDRRPPAEAAAQEALRAMFGRILAALPPDAPAGAARPVVAVAVSGGSDSSALMHLAAEVAPAAGLGLRAVTVDHRLRAASAQEARAVAAAAMALGIAHDIVVWHDAAPPRAGRAVAAGNLMARARAARYRLLADWARAHGVAAVLLGHTADDLAEGLVMRLARRSGVDGLAAMADLWRATEAATEDAAEIATEIAPETAPPTSAGSAFGAGPAVIFARPFLGLSRASLRAILSARGLGWIEDPTNADPAFARSRARAAIAHLAPLGLRPDDLAAAALHLRAARTALAHHAAEAARAICQLSAGDLVFAAAPFAALPDETRRRLLAGALAFVAGPGYPPRAPALARLQAVALAGGRAQLAGCRVEPAAGGFRIGREGRALRGHSVPAGGLFDGRWALSGPPPPAQACLRPLGPEGLRACPDWRARGLPRATLMAAPALWLGARLIAAPLARPGEAWEIALVPGRTDFAASLLAH